jgi:hypothetical protein
MGSGAVIRTKFHKDWFRHSKVNRWGDTQTDRDTHTHTHTHANTQQRDLISLLDSFKIRKVCLK